MPVRRPRGGGRAAVVRGRRGGPRGGRPRRRLPARDARHGRGGADAGRGRLRPQPRDPARHRQHRLRREDRRHLPRRAGHWPSPRPAAPTSPPCTGTWSATCATAARCTATASCWRGTGSSCDRPPHRAPGPGGDRLLAGPEAGRAGADPGAVPGRAAGGRAGPGGARRRRHPRCGSALPVSSTRSCPRPPRSSWRTCRPSPSRRWTRSTPGSPCTPRPTRASCPRSTRPSCESARRRTGR